MYRSHIDRALIRIAATAGKAKQARALLEQVGAAAGPLSYLAAAAGRVAKLLDASVLAASRELHLDALWDGRLAQLIDTHSSLRDERSDQLVADEASPLDEAFYPAAAAEAFAQGLLLDEQDADLVLLWKRPEGISVHRAHPEGFWKIARDPVHWIAQLADALERGASPQLVRSRIEQFVSRSRAKSFRLVTAVGEMSDVVDAGEAADDDLEARLRAYGEAGPQLKIALYTIVKEKIRNAPNVRTHKTVFEGDGAALAASAADLSASVGRAYFELTLRGRGVMTVWDGLSSSRVLDRAADVADVKRRRGVAVLDVGTAERSASGSTLVLVGDLDAKEIKARLRELVSSSGAKRFDLRVLEDGRLFTSHSGLAQKKLLRMASMLPAELDRGCTVEVSAVGVAEKPSTEVVALWL